jgi:predicted double-glycine peptidase
MVKVLYKNINILIITLFVFLIFQGILWAKTLDVPYVAQFNGTACGAAALEMVYKYYGKSDVSQEDIYNKYQEIEPEFGKVSRISTANLVSDAQSRGFQSFWKRVNYLDRDEALSVLKTYLNLKIPVIVCQQFTKKSPKIGHFRVVFGVDDEDNIYFHDPRFGGFKKWPIEQFMDYWQPTGQNVTGGVYIIVKKVNAE